jgi:hypothetical protein
MCIKHINHLLLGCKKDQDQLLIHSQPNSSNHRDSLQSKHRYLVRVQLTLSKVHQ